MAIKVKYLGTNIGKIYFSDIERRLGLGGAQEGAYNGGQDRYIIWGEEKVLQESGEVLLSVAQGVLKYFSDVNSSDVFSANHGAPLVIETGVYTSADEIPRSDIGVTAGSRFEDEYITKLADAKWAPTGAASGAGPTGTYHGESF